MTPHTPCLLAAFVPLAFAEAWMYTLILFGAGLLLAMAEVFIPSGGILAGCSIATFLAATVFGFLWHPWAGVGVLALAAVLAPLGVRMLIKVVPHIRATRDLVLSADGEKVVVKSKGGPAADGGTCPAVGMSGTVVRPLRPAGTVEIEGNRVDCVSIGGYIEAGAPVVVVEIEGPRTVVRRVE